MMLQFLVILLEDLESRCFLDTLYFLPPFTSPYFEHSLNLIIPRLVRICLQSPHGFHFGMLLIYDILIHYRISLSVWGGTDRQWEYPLGVNYLLNLSSWMMNVFS